MESTYIFDTFNYKYRAAGGIYRKKEDFAKLKPHVERISAKMTLAFSKYGMSWNSSKTTQSFSDEARLRIMPMTASSDSGSSAARASIEMEGEPFAGSNDMDGRRRWMRPIAFLRNDMFSFDAASPERTRRQKSDNVRMQYRSI